MGAREKTSAKKERYKFKKLSVREGTKIEKQTRMNCFRSNRYFNIFSHFFLIARLGVSEPNQQEENIRNIIAGPYPVRLLSLSVFK